MSDLPLIRFDAKDDADAIARLSAWARGSLMLDASESTVFARELLAIRAGMFEQKFPDLLAMSFIPRMGGVKDTDTEATYRTVTEYGKTNVGGSYSTEAPRADVSFSEATPQKIRPLTAAYGYDFFEARVAAATGSNMQAHKASAARRAIAQEVDRILTFGDTTRYGATLYGLANLGVVDTLAFTAATGLSGSKTFELKTPDEVVADLFNIANAMVSNSRGVEVPTDLILPLSTYNYCATRRMGDGIGNTILEHYKQNAVYARNVSAWHVLDAAPASEWTGKRMICFKKDPEVLEYILPVEFEQLAPQLRGMETVTPCHARIGGVVLRRPKALSYGDGI